MNQSRYRVEDICAFLEFLFPLNLAESWDNVGLLVGKRASTVKKMMTCLTLTREVCQEAIENEVDMIMSHHPFPFKGLKKITDGRMEGRLLLSLIKNDIAVYSSHTAFDSAENGLNEQLCHVFNATPREHLKQIEGVEGLGAGRIATLPERKTLRELCTIVKKQLKVPYLKVVGNLDNSISRVATACGSGGDFFELARIKRADLFITGEASFHTCLAAKDAGIGIILLGHYFSERFAMENIVQQIEERFPGIESWASEKEQSPIQFID